MGASWGLELMTRTLLSVAAAFSDVHHGTGRLPSASSRGDPNHIQNGRFPRWFVHCPGGASMKWLCSLLVLLVTASSAHADAISFSVAGHRIHIEAPRNCRSASCASITIPGVYESR